MLRAHDRPETNLAPCENQDAFGSDLLLAKLYENHPEYVTRKPPAPEKPAPKVIQIQAPAVVIPIPVPVSDMPVIPAQPSLNTIASIVADFYGLSLLEILARRRAKEIVVPRQIAMYLASKLTRKTLSTIARYLDMDHSTVIHGARKIKTDMETNPRLADEIEVLKLHIAQAMLNPA